jgi:hypothetical protein
MQNKGRSWELVWVAIALCAVLTSLIVVISRNVTDPRVQSESKSQRIALIQNMRLALAAASDELNYAVMSTNEQSSKAFLERAVAKVDAVKQSRLELDKVVPKSNTESETSLIARVDQTFLEFQSVSEQLSRLALQSSNRKAYALAFGPAMDVLQAMDKEFEKLAARQAISQTEANAKILKTISDARLSGLQIQVHLLPHIAEPSDQKMNELEKTITEEDHRMQEGLLSLGSSLDSSVEIEKIKSLYDEFKGIESQIISLSRENSDIRSVELALNEKRKSMLACEDALANLENAIRAEPIVSTIPKGRGHE